MEMFNKIVRASQSLKNYFYAVLKVLPPYAKITALASVVTLFYAIYPQVPDKGFIAYDFNRIEEVDGKMQYTMNPQWGEKDEVPDYYVNRRSNPESGDRVILLHPYNSSEDDLYLYYHKGTTSYEEWVEALYASEKERTRRKLFLSFLMSASICFVSFPDLARRMAALVPGQERYAGSI